MRYVETSQSVWEGCQATDEVYVSQPSPISTSYTKNDVTCHGGTDGQIILSVNGGGTPPYALDWLNFGNSNTNNLNNLEAGFYDLEISDSNNCVDFLTIEITESSSPLTVQVQNQTCLVYL